jgi:selenocysteine lyase/cysteine desulfurase
MFELEIDEQTKFVAVTHVCYRNGAKLDIAGIVRLAHSKGVMVLLDCYRSVGSLDVDVKSLDVDIAVGGMLKYLLGTAGIGFLYVRRELVQSMLPTNSGWLAQGDVGAMDITANRPASNARRFEAGTPPVVKCYAAEAGLKLLLNVGMPAIENGVCARTRRCMQRMEEIGWPSITPNEDVRRGATGRLPRATALGFARSSSSAAASPPRGMTTSERASMFTITRPTSNLLLPP